MKFHLKHNLEIFQINYELGDDALGEGNFFLFPSPIIILTFLKFDEFSRLPNSRFFYHSASKFIDWV